MGEATDGVVAKEDMPFVRAIFLRQASQGRHGIASGWCHLNLGDADVGSHPHVVLVVLCQPAHKLPLETVGLGQQMSLVGALIIDHDASPRPHPQQPAAVGQ